MTKEEKLKIIKEELGYDPYPPTSPQKTDIKEFLASFNKNLKSKKNFWLCGRIMAFRDHGKIVFIDLKDFSGRVQIILKREETDGYENFVKIADIGDFFGFYGSPFLPSSKEKSLLAKKWVLLSKSLKNFPKEYYKVRDEELLVRNPYLKTIFYDEEKETFYYRFRLLEELRKILWERDFIEVETPILQTHYGGALARPFITYLEALKEKLYLRIAPELYLKKMIVGGFEKIFEIGKNFRNEGIDREHNPEFTMMELYFAYQDREGLMKFTEEILKELVKRYNKMRGKKGLEIEYQGKKINLAKKWKVFKYVELLKERTGLDYFKNTLEDFLKLAEKEKIEFNPKIITKGKIVDEIFKKLIRPTLIEPTFLIDHPKDISPLAKSHPENNQLTLRFQLYLFGFEIANAFAELNDPLDQKERFLKEVEELKKGNLEAHPYDETFIEALEYGMPPTAGLGIGLDRLFTILLDKKSIKDVIYFPFVKREND
ncbi:MAG: lysine--tRNA ligase [Candidatus Pacebacteria bacterium]|nr:lysine--tRNA ligase [Candidatus Paceibacterota bacterium]